MELALGVLEWSPGAFWESTPYDLRAAVRGRRRAAEAAAAPLQGCKLSRVEVNNLRELADSMPKVIGGPSHG